jgi:hypothetical protein
MCPRPCKDSSFVSFVGQEDRTIEGPETGKRRASGAEVSLAEKRLCSGVFQSYRASPALVPGSLQRAAPLAC